jgi:stringent starvation protein B
MNADERPSKREAFLAFLREGWVSLHLDARRSGVAVPDSFAAEPHLVLQYGRNMPIPIPDLDVTDQGVSATLSFSRTPCLTHVPWSAVYVVACTDGRGILYYEDVPQEVSLSAPPTPPPVPRPTASYDDEATADSPSPALQRLRSIPAESAPLAEDDLDSELPKRRRRPQLRLVK